jgi:hypothetical protein
MDEEQKKLQHYWTMELDTLLKKKENTEFKNIKILLFFDQKHSQFACFPIPGTGFDNLSTYKRISNVQSSLNPRRPEIFGLLCDHISSLPFMPQRTALKAL